MKNKIVFTINSLGECIAHEGEDPFGTLLSGSVQISQMPADHREHGAFWLRKAALDLSMEQFLLYNRWHEANSLVNESSLYRFYGNMMEDGTRHLWLSVEFWIPEDEDWEANEKLMRDFQKRWGLDETVMVEDAEFTQYICNIDVYFMPDRELRRRAIMMRREIRTGPLGDIVNNVC